VPSGADGTGHGEHSVDVPGGPVDGHLYADLRARDQILVDQGVEHRPGLHAVDGQEQIVAVDQPPGNRLVDDVAQDRSKVPLGWPGPPAGRSGPWGGQAAKWKRGEPSGVMTLEELLAGLHALDAADEDR
jgi:hypothetical protein